MTPDGLALVQKAQVDRATAGNFAGMRRATVTAVSPFTISMNGVSIVNPPSSPNYRPSVGDVVLVLMDGAAPYVLESMVAGGNGNMVSHVYGTGSNQAYNGSAGAMTTIFTLPSYTFVNGRRYILTWSWRAASTPTFWQVLFNGVATGLDFYHDLPNAGVINWMGGVGSSAFTANGANTLSLVVRSQGVAGGNMYSEGGGYAAVVDWGA